MSVATSSERSISSVVDEATMRETVGGWMEEHTAYMRTLCGIEGHTEYIHHRSRPFHRRAIECTRGSGEKRPTKGQHALRATAHPFAHSPRSNFLPSGSMALTWNCASKSTASVMVRLCACVCDGETRYQARSSQMPKCVHRAILRSDCRAAPAVTSEALA